MTAKPLEVCVVDLRPREIQFKNARNFGKILQLLIQLVGTRRLGQHHSLDLLSLVVLLNHDSRTTQFDHRIGVATSGDGQHHQQCRHTGQSPPTRHLIAPGRLSHRGSAHLSLSEASGVSALLSLAAPSRPGDFDSAELFPSAR